VLIVYRRERDEGLLAGCLSDKEMTQLYNMKGIASLFRDMKRVSIRNWVL
jgi:hypothetical protein